jgi:monoamine oxidase
MAYSVRRRFLQQLLALGSARLVAGCGGGGTGRSTGTTSTTATTAGAGTDVVVIGGGLSGLCSAYELKNRGYNVLAVLEAQDRVGGRVLTLRDGLMNGQYAEGGATRIASTHNYTLGYVQQFGLKLREFVTSEPALYYLKGQPPFIHNDGDPWPTSVLSFMSAEASLGADSIVFDYEKLDEIGNALEASWPSGKALDYDGMGIEAYLQLQGASDDVILLDKAINGTELDADNALYWLMTDVLDYLWNQTWAIEGGNDQLPKAFAAALGSLVQLGSVVTAIDHDDRGVTVTYTQGGETKTLHGDYCVCAIPFTMLRKVKVTPAFSDPKTKVVDTMSYMPVGRCYLQTETRFWNAKMIGGLKVARTDTYVERLWDMSKVQDGTNGLLLAYMQNQNGLAFGMQPDAMKIDYVKAGVAEFFPEIDSEFLTGIYKVWQDDPWVGGAWGYYKPGEMKEGFPAAKKSEGRVHFCGEHTSPWSGWMQGALESANRVVAEIAGYI